MTTGPVDYYDVQRMVEDEARSRRAAVDELRELIDQRTREHSDEMRELRESVASALIEGGTLA